MSDARITDRQKKYLKSLVCQRISDDEANGKLIDQFENSRNKGLPEALRKSRNADKQDKVAYYIIKDPKDQQPMLFFSLKCGEIHKPLIPEKLESARKSAQMVLKAARTVCRKPNIPHMLDNMNKKEIQKKMAEEMELAWDVEVEDWAKDVIEKQLVDGDLPEAAWAEILQRVFRSREKLERYEREKRRKGKNIIHIKKSFAAVELVHFCVHDPAKEKWEDLKMGRSLGKTMFWNFVEPVIRDIRKLVGCEYIYLFAADDSKEGSLIKYYQELGFACRDNLYVTRPEYDAFCHFMCQEVTSLRARRNVFFREFNNPEDPHKI